jgi:hypothetical protein
MPVAGRCWSAWRVASARSCSASARRRLARSSSRPIPRALVQRGAQPVALGPQLPGGELAQVQGAGRVDRQGLLAGVGQGLGELAVAVGRV